VGQTAAFLLGVPLLEYVPDPSLLPIRLIDLSSGNEAGVLAGPADYPSDVAFSPDDKQLASLHRNGEIFLWDIASKSLVKRLTTIMGIRTIKFLPDGKTLVAYNTGIGNMGYFLLWNLETGYMTKVWRAPYKTLGELKLTNALDGLDYSYPTFDVSPDGELLATATGNGEVALWDTATFQQTVLQKAAEKKGMFNVQLLIFSVDGQTLTYFDALTKQTHLWDVASRAEIKTLPIGSSYFAYSSANKVLAWADRKELLFATLDQPDSPVKVMDFQEGLLIAIPALAFSPDGNRLIVGGFGTKTPSGDNVIYVVKFNQ
jgi:WD40 repeat protein